MGWDCIQCARKRDAPTSVIVGEVVRKRARQTQSLSVWPPLLLWYVELAFESPAIP